MNWIDEVSSYNKGGITNGFRFAVYVEDSLNAGHAYDDRPEPEHTCYVIYRTNSYGEAREALLQTAGDVSTYEGIGTGSSRTVMLVQYADNYFGYDALEWYKKDGYSFNTPVVHAVNVNGQWQKEEIPW